MNLLQLKKIIDKYEYVSFDIFDTLIVRNVEKPTDVFEIIDRILNEKNNKSFNFKKLRLEAQEEAYQSTDCEEITINDIYNQMPVFGDISMENLIEIECEAELGMCQANIEMFDLYNYCLVNGKKVILISDMYMNADFIERLLKKCGYNQFRHLYLSSLYKKRKSSGRLYEFALRNENIDKSKIIHIGDNLKSDYIRPCMMGIKSFHYKRQVGKMSFADKNFCDEKLANSVISSLIINNHPRNQTPYFNFGFEILGPLMLGFSIWLDKNLAENQKDSVTFLSREGSFIKDCFDLFYENKYKTSYLYLSRQSVRVPSLVDIKSFDELMGKIDFRINPTIGVLLGKCGLNSLALGQLMKKHNVTSEDYLTSSKQIVDFVSEILPVIRKNAKKQLQLLTLYLKQQTLWDKGQTLVDIGWKGSMQHFLTELFPSYMAENNIKGYYIGTIGQARKSEDTAGYINCCDKSIEAGMTLFETLFMANHGSTLGYITDSNSDIIPDLADIEYCKNDVDNIQQIQDGAKNFLKLVKSIDLDFSIIIKDQIIFRQLESILINPTFYHSKLLGEFSYYDTTIDKLAHVNSRFNIKRLKADFINAGWKIGFLKRLLIIKLPYFKIYRFIKNMIGEKK